MSMLLYVTTVIILVEVLIRLECYRMGPEHATNKIVVRTCNGIEVSSCYRGKSWIVMKLVF